LTFAAYVLVPFVASLLIQEDLSCNTGQAYKVMVYSSEAGDHIHPLADDDPEFEAIHRKNCMLARKEQAQVSFLFI
jgi:RTC4-like domain